MLINTTDSKLGNECCCSCKSCRLYVHSCLYSDSIVGLSVRAAGKVGGTLTTWQWLAPEVIDSQSDAYDEQSDIFSLGVRKNIWFSCNMRRWCYGNWLQDNGHMTV